MFGSLIIINYFSNYQLNYIFKAVSATRKITHMFSVFSVFAQTHKNKSIINLYQKELLGYFSEDVKICPSYVLNW